MSRETVDVTIIGAGPAGSVAAAFLARQGYAVLVLERQVFPRFVIGESLLPHCMESMARAGLLPAVQARGYQRKDGALFSFGDRHATIEFSAQFTPGYASTYQVPRDDFDQTLALGAAGLGAIVRHGQQVVAVDVERDRPQVTVQPDGGAPYVVESRFLLDASGYGRVLPRLLGLDKPSTLPPRTSLFAHVTGDERTAANHHDKILIGVHPTLPGTWYWLIPFAGGRSSIGVVGDGTTFAGRPEALEARLRSFIDDERTVHKRLQHSEFAFAPRTLTGYSASVTRLHGRHFALIGNAGEFLDPVFSSGVTIAMHGADLAAGCVDRLLRGAPVDWEREFATPLMRGVDVFGAFVRGWYSGTLQRVIFQPNPPPDVYEMICSILAGYAWDERNPYCKQTERRLTALSAICNPLEET